MLICFHFSSFLSLSRQEHGLVPLKRNFPVVFRGEAGLSAIESKKHHESSQAQLPPDSASPACMHHP